MIKCKFTVTTSINAYSLEFTANSLDHAAKEIEKAYNENDHITYAGERYRIRIPKHAVLEYKVEELG